MWVFQIPEALTTASSSRVLLTNGASACNVYWQIGSSATLGTNSTFVGTVMALTSISVTTGTNIEGRALARNGAVTLDNNRIFLNNCATATTGGTTSGTTTGTTTGNVAGNTSGNTVGNTAGNTTSGNTQGNTAGNGTAGNTVGGTTGGPGHGGKPGKPHHHDNKPGHHHGQKPHHGEKPHHGHDIDHGKPSYGEQPEGNYGYADVPHGREAALDYAKGYAG